MNFLVLPDCTDATRYATSTAPRSRVDHASGRPWVIGDWPEDEAVLITAGTKKMLLLGSSRINQVAAVTTLEQMTSLHDVDALARQITGSVHLIVSFDGEVRIQGSVAGVKQVFWSTIDGVPVAAGSVDALTPWTEAPLDPSMLATRLLCPGGAPWPLSQRTVRVGIETLSAGHWLQLRPGGQPRTVRWWNLPEPELALEEAADRLRVALHEAMSARIQTRIQLSADLSGGMDSTALCFLAIAAGAHLSTYHVSPVDNANQDTVWAHRAAALMPDAQHHVLPPNREENLFDIGYTDVLGPLAPEGPSTWASGLAHIRNLAATASTAGSSLHITGFGGDELFGRLPACAWSLVRADLGSGARLVNRYRLANRWSLGGTVRALADRQTFAQNLVLAAGRLTDPPAPASEPDFSWTGRLRMPNWCTEDAVSAVQHLLLTTQQQSPAPLDADRARHQALASLVFEGNAVRQVNTALARTEIRWDAPFLDDRVIEAALATRIDQRMAAGRVKPLLVAAMRPVVPAPLLDRRDKGEFCADTFRGLERNRERLLALAESSRLADLGLIDAAAFRAAILNPGPMSHHLQPLQTTVACESWLRTYLPTESAGAQR